MVTVFVEISWIIVDFLIWDLTCHHKINQTLALSSGRRVCWFSSQRTPRNTWYNDASVGPWEEIYGRNFFVAEVRWHWDRWEFFIICLDLGGGFSNIEIFSLRNLEKWGTHCDLGTYFGPIGLVNQPPASKSLPLAEKAWLIILSSFHPTLRTWSFPAEWERCSGSRFWRVYVRLNARVSIRAPHGRSRAMQTGSMVRLGWNSCNGTFFFSSPPGPTYKHNVYVWSVVVRHRTWCPSPDPSFQRTGRVMRQGC